MKHVLVLPAIFLLFTYPMKAQPDPLESRVYPWPDQLEEQAPGVAKAQVLSGSTTALRWLTVDAFQIQPGVSQTGGGTMESLLIVKRGVVTVTYQGEQVDLGPGSVHVPFRGGLDLMNNQDELAEFYIFRYESRKDKDYNSIDDGNWGYLVDWDKLEVKETQKGERRHYFDGPTPSLSRFEMHVTTLNEGLRSHGVHTHREEEFLLIIKGDVEEHIDGVEHPATVGGLIFLDAMVPHTITNVGKGAAQYFAFKWE